MPTLKVYLKPGCPWCVDAVAYLEREGFSYEGIDVIADRTQYAEMQRLSGQSCAPTLTYGELILPDFDVDEMKAFFEDHGITP
ncbi:MAG: glutaredoxin domain-containing protein [Verrucomicrobiales bacterium]|nr:glutaredoxin family protein [bacterium]MDF2378068.1 glutaredoxin domain-containing protein [Verrucomicrobiales bacterium]